MNLLDRLRAVCGSRRGAGDGAVRGIIAALAVIGVALTAAVPAKAQGIPLIRDTEIENLLNDYAQPIFKAANLSAGRVQMRIVRSQVFNAFVVDGRNVFIHTGALMEAKSPNEIIGVIAHEAGHIAGAHLAGLRRQVKQGQAQALLMQILGLGAVVLGATTDNSSLGNAGTGILYGGQEIVTRSLLSYRRSQEASADQAGLSYLNRTQQSGRGMLATFERFAQQEYISDRHKDPFVRSHPVATDRLNQLRRNVEASPFYDRLDPPELQLRHDLMRAKLAGYLENPSVVFNRYPLSDNSLPAQYARAIATFFRGGRNAIDASVAALDQLIAQRPNYPYFHEVKGDFLMRSGRSAEAIPHLRRALKLAGGDASLIQVQLAAALQSAKGKAGLGESIALLRKSLVDDLNPRAFRLLATAYYNQGEGPKADAVTAQAYFLEGDLKQAQIFARRAHPRLKKGSPEWIKNDDIINFQPET